MASRPLARHDRNQHLYSWDRRSCVPLLELSNVPSDYVYLCSPLRGLCRRLQRHVGGLYPICSSIRCVDESGHDDWVVLGRERRRIGHLWTAERRAGHRLMRGNTVWALRTEAVTGI